MDPSESNQKAFTAKPTASSRRLVQEGLRVGFAVSEQINDAFEYRRMPPHTGKQIFLRLIAPCDSFQCSALSHRAMLMKVKVGSPVQQFLS